MPTNPFLTLKDWQLEKKKYGIPDKVIKSGAFGERTEKLRQAYNAGGGLSTDVNNFPAVLAVLDQGRTLVEEWLTRAKALKDKDFKDKPGAIKFVENYHEQLVGTISRVRGSIDPLHEPRSTYSKVVKLYRDAMADPADPEALYLLWDTGARQYIGQGFKVAVKNAGALNYDRAVTKGLKDYDDLVTKWMDPMLQDLQKVAATPKARETFLNDMHLALNIAGNVIKLTA